MPSRCPQLSEARGPAWSRRIPVCASTIQPASSTAFRIPPVEDEVLQRVAAGIEANERRRQERERQADRVEQELVRDPRVSQRPRAGTRATP
jgi:hypothetical protein